jgi:hypothetical protein
MQGCRPWDCQGGGAWHQEILADQLTISQPGTQMTDYARLITNGTPRFSDLPSALNWSTLQPIHTNGMASLLLSVS